MATQLKEYGARINGELYPCRLNDRIYSQGGVAAALGFEKGGSSVNFNGIGDFRSLRRAGAIVKVTANGTQGEGTGITRKSFQLWCVASSLSAAKGKLVNETINGYNINTVSNRLTTRFR
jgi:hypothetical protein